MSQTSQTDLFKPAQPGLFDAASLSVDGDTDRIRRLACKRLDALLAEARAATRMPWPPRAAAVNATIFHNMANWLPEPEREPARAAFRAELDRLEAAS